MTRVPWGWADAPVLWIFPELAVGRKEVLSLKLNGGGRQDWTLCSLGGGDSFWGDNMDQETPVLGTQGAKCPYFSVPTYPCLCCLLAACTWLCLSAPVSACLCLGQGLPVLGVSSLPHRQCHRFKFVFHRVERGGSGLLALEIFRVRTPCISLPWWGQAQLLRVYVWPCVFESMWSKLSSNSPSSCITLFSTGISMCMTTITSGEALAKCILGTSDVAQWLRSRLVGASEALGSISIMCKQQKGKHSTQTPYSDVGPWNDGSFCFVLVNSCMFLY